jgi:hypothetical protein
MKDLILFLISAIHYLLRRKALGQATNCTRTKPLFWSPEMVIELRLRLRGTRWVTEIKTSIATVFNDLHLNTRVTTVQRQ